MGQTRETFHATNWYSSYDRYNTQFTPSFAYQLAKREMAPRHVNKVALFRAVNNSNQIAEISAMLTFFLIEIRRTTAKPVSDLFSTLHTTQIEAVHRHVRYRTFEHKATLPLGRI